MKIFKITCEIEKEYTPFLFLFIVMICYFCLTSNIANFMGL